MLDLTCIERGKLMEMSRMDEDDEDDEGWTKSEIKPESKYTYRMART